MVFVVSVTDIAYYYGLINLSFDAGHDRMSTDGEKYTEIYPNFNISAYYCV